MDILVRSSVSIGAQIRLATSSWKVSVNGTLPNAHGPLRAAIVRRNLEIEIHI
jgi:hypothetical protein